MKPIDLTMPMGAIFSEDGRYRYALWRVWSQIKPLLLFVGLNPSTANGLINDPTVARLMARARKEGFGGLLAGNLYGLVSEDPKILLKDIEVIGTENDAYLKLLIELASKGRVLCGWGSFPAARKRAKAVLKLIPLPYCLGVNDDGQPTHPLYIAYDVPMVKYTGGEG
jgi:hypothetical protein